MSVESSVATIASARHPYSAAILDGSPSRRKGGHVLCSHCGNDSLVDWCWRGTEKENMLAGIYLDISNYQVLFS